MKIGIILLNLSQLLIDTSPSFFKEATNSGYKLAAICLKQSLVFKKLLSDYQLENLLSSHLVSNEAERACFHPADIEEVIKELKVDSKEAVYVSTVVNDAEVAKQVGIRFIGVTGGQTKKEDFSNYSPWTVINSLAELIDALKALEEKVHDQGKISKLEAAKQFEVVTSDSDEIKSEIFKLRYQMIRELYDEKFHGDFFEKDATQETDKYDKHSGFCAIRKGGKIVGTGRVIFGRNELQEESFQPEFKQYIHQKPLINSLSIEHIAEFSRLFILPEHRSNNGFLAILKGRVALCAQNGITHIFLTTEPALSERYRQQGLFYTQISPTFDFNGTIKATYFNDIQLLLDKLYEFHQPTWDFVTENGKYYPYKRGFTVTASLILSNNPHRWLNSSEQKAEDNAATVDPLSEVQVLKSTNNSSASKRWCVIS